jgi:hypothetical protein
MAAPTHARCVELGLTALSGCMWASGPRFHAAVARGGLLADIVAALTAHAWEPRLAASAARAVEAWSERVRGCPDFRAAAATLHAQLPGPPGLSRTRVSDDDASPDTPGAGVGFATRNGIAVPLRANGGVVPTAADEHTNAAVAAALLVRGRLRACVCAACLSAGALTRLC